MTQMIERKELIENLYGDVLFLENRIKTKSVLNDYDCEVMLDITKNIYSAIQMLETAIISPVKVDQPIWTAEPFTDEVMREGYITMLECDDNGLFGFWTSFGEIPLSAEFIAEDIGKTVFLSREQAEKALYKGDENK